MKHVKLYEEFLNEKKPKGAKKKKADLYEAQMGVLDENININQVNYGNPPKEYFDLMQEPDDYIKNWFIELLALVSVLCGHIKSALC
jgi:hypothetical protein